MFTYFADCCPCRYHVLKITIFNGLGYAVFGLQIIFKKLFDLEDTLLVNLKNCPFEKGLEIQITYRSMYCTMVFLFL